MPAVHRYAVWVVGIKYLRLHWWVPNTGKSEECLPPALWGLCSHSWIQLERH